MLKTVMAQAPKLDLKDQLAAMIPIQVVTQVARISAICLNLNHLPQLADLIQGGHNGN
jgi:hypothetical protein